MSRLYYCRLIFEFNSFLKEALFSASNVSHIFAGDILVYRENFLVRIFSYFQDLTFSICGRKEGFFAVYRESFLMRILLNFRTFRIRGKGRHKEVHKLVAKDEFHYLPRACLPIAARLRQRLRIATQSMLIKDPFVDITGCTAAISFWTAPLLDWTG